MGILGERVLITTFFFSTSLSTRFPPVISFLPLISAPTGFHDWGLVTRWAQLLITSNYYLPSTPKDHHGLLKLSIKFNNSLLHFVWINKDCKENKLQSARARDKKKPFLSNCSQKLE